ncbi:hypothetical protein MKW94_006242, partial [Papaver nudicaule]|nr:hypothetical protein [Papaver nudicaule]
GGLYIGHAGFYPRVQDHWGPDTPSVIYDVLAIVNAAIAHQPPPPAEENQVPPTRIITPISSLKPGLEEWTIKARVTSKGGIKEHNFSTCVVRIFSFDLLDSDGGQIHVKCSGNALVHQFFPHIKPGKVYLVSQGNLKHVPKHCNYLQKEWQIILKPTSVLEKCEEEDSSIPQQQFYFTPICDVKDAEDKSFLDVIGIVTNVSPPAWVRCPNGGAERVKRTLVLKDGTGETVEILLWGGFCDDE